MEALVTEYAQDYDSYVREFEAIKNSNSSLEITLALGDLFFQNTKAYGKTIKSVAEKTHRDIHENFPSVLIDNLCFYTSSYFADACKYLGVGDVSIVRGNHVMFSPKQMDRTWRKDGSTGLYKKVWLHHWNLDRQSKQFVDIKSPELIVTDCNNPSFKERYLFRKEDINYDSKKILGFPLLETAKIALGI